LPRRYDAIFRRGELAAIDTASRRIKLSNGHDMGYDYSHPGDRV
jgi:hypothetical protein